MSAEYPTLNIPSPINHVKEIVNNIARDFSGELVEESNQFKLKVKYDQILDETELDAKLTLAASSSIRSRGFMLVWLAGFLTILSILALVSARFRAADAEKNEIYYNSLSAKIAQVETLKSQNSEIIDFKKQQKDGLQEAAENRVVASWIYRISGSLISAAAILLLLAYRSKIIRKKRITEIKVKLLQESSQNGRNPNLDSREDICEFRLFDSENSTEFIFEDEEGSVLLVYLVGLVITASYTLRNDTVINGNEPLKEMINHYKQQEITSIKLDKSVLDKIDFD
ncbi:MAG: hypothetical protein GY786_18200 [Proteobacteria bacterium]|nr:hypothetical protein [Pseudomonadota bacterium]